MANRTITATCVQNGPTLTRQGLNYASGTFDFSKAAGFGASISNSLFIHMVRVPHNARIIDVRVTLYDRTDGGFAVGDLSLSDRYITALSMTADGQTNLLNNNAGAGYKISLTASDEASWEPIIFQTTNATSTLSTTGCVHMGVYFLMEPNTQ